MHAKTNSITISLNIMDECDSIQNVSFILNGNIGKNVATDTIKLIIRKHLHKLLYDMDTAPESWSFIETASPDSLENQDQPFPPF